MYVPDGVEVLTATPYHTAVVSFDAVVAVVLIVFGDPVAGTAANLIVPLIAALLAPEVGPAPNPPMLSTRYPHVLTAATTGVAWLPLDAGIVLLPDVNVLVPVVSASLSVYPLASFVLTVMVSLAIVCTPPDVGVASMLTVPEEVNKLIVEPIAELTVVVMAFADGATLKMMRLTAIKPAANR